MVDIVIIIVIVAILALSIGYIVKAKKSGVKCIGCSSGSSCSGNCSGCTGDCSSYSSDVKK